MINSRTYGKNLEIVHGGILNNKASDEKLSPLARYLRLTSSLVLAGIEHLIVVSFVRYVRSH
jgi:hypothetical protein